MKLKTTMKFILAALTIYTASAAYTCNEECAGGIYGAIAEVAALDNGMTDLDLAVYGYILYTNVAEAGNADLTAAFMAGVGEGCELDDDWTRKQVADCFNDATDDDVTAAQEGFVECDDANNDGCSRIMGILAHQFAPDGKIAAAFDSELSASDLEEAINIYTTFMAVVGNWEDLDADCQGAIETAADYSEGDDVVLAIADNNAAITEALGGDDCGSEAIADTVTAMTADLEDAVVLADKLTGEAGGDAEDDADESSAAMISAFVGLIAFML